MIKCWHDFVIVSVYYNTNINISSGSIQSTQLLLFMTEENSENKFQWMQIKKCNQAN